MVDFNGWLVIPPGYRLEPKMTAFLPPGPGTLVELLDGQVSTRPDEDLSWFQVEWGEPSTACGERERVACRIGAALQDGEPERSSETLRVSDHLHAVIRRTGNGEPAAMVAYTAPGEGEGRAANSDTPDVAGMARGDVEARRTEEAMGKVISITSVTRASRERRGVEQGPYTIGSVGLKLVPPDVVAGAYGPVGAPLAIEHRGVPSALRLVRPDPRLGLDQGSFYVNTSRREWVPEPISRRRGSRGHGTGGSDARAALDQVEHTPGALSSRRLAQTARRFHALEATAANRAARPEELLDPADEG